MEIMGAGEAEGRRSAVSARVATASADIAIVVEAAGALRGAVVLVEHVPAPARSAVVGGEGTSGAGSSAGSTGL